MTDNINNNVSNGSIMLSVDITRYLQQQMGIYRLVGDNVFGRLESN